MSDLHADLLEAAGSTTSSADVERIRQRGGQLRRRQVTARAAGACAVVAAVLLFVGMELGDDDRSTVITNTPNSVPQATTPEFPAPSTVTPGRGSASSTDAPASGSSTESAGAAARTGRQRIFEDPLGDANETPSAEPDASLDLLALDVAYDGEAVTFVHVVDGEPTTEPPSGATGRHHDTYFRIPGHNLVQMRVETMKRDVVVTVFVVEPGDRFGKNPRQRCTSCEVAFDARAHEVRVRMPVTFLNDVMGHSGGGQIRRGVEVGGWEAYTAKTIGTRTYYEERESPHFYSATPMDSMRRYDVSWKVP
jgi:hypothetical protein